MTFQPDSARVLVRPFTPGGLARVLNIIGRALVLSEAEVEEMLAAWQRISAAGMGIFVRSGD